LSDFNHILNVPAGFHHSPPVSNFTEIHPVWKPRWYMRARTNRRSDIHDEANRRFLRLRKRA